MITNFVISLVTTVVSFFINLLPSMTIPSWFGTDSFGTTLANQVGGLLVGAKDYLPVGAIVDVVAAVCTLLPVFAAFWVFEWVWKHVPTIAGFGTGNG